MLLPSFPEQFVLSLEKPIEEKDLVTGMEAVCVVTTEKGFTEQTKAEVKFSITCTTLGKKKRGNLRQDLCGLSTDSKQFRIGFDLVDHGLYKVVVKLGDIPVKNSPLTFIVATSAKTEGKLDSSTIPDRTISTSPALPDLTRTSVVTAEMKAVSVSSTTEVEISNPTLNDLSNISSNCGQEKDLAVKTAANGQTQPSQKLEQLMDLVPKKKDDYLERLVNECEVVKGLGLELTLALLIREIDLMKVGKIEHSPLTKNLAKVSNSSGHGSRTVSRSGPKQTPVATGPLNLNTVLKLSKILGIPMSRDEKGPERSLHAPIGMCVLNNGDIVVASTFSHKVKMFSSEGNFLRQVDPGAAEFFKPSDMVCLRSGQFVVRDNNCLRLFSCQGIFISSLWEDSSKTKCFGLAEDDKGHLVSIKKSGLETELLFFNIDEKKIVKKMSLEDVIEDKGNSKCRFLTFQGGNFYITDLGLNQVYVIDSKTYDVILKYGKTGSGPGCFDDPAGLGVDPQGNMIVADSKNHRLCVYNAEGQFLNQIQKPEIKRPSGLVLIPSSRNLFVLNLGGPIALVMYKL